MTRLSLGLWKPVQTPLHDFISEVGEEYSMFLPVSMLSLTMQSPASSRLSHGSWVRDGSDTSYTSPGTSSLLSTCRPVATY